MDRLSLIQEEIKRHAAHAFVLVNHESSGQPSTRWLSGFSGSESVIVVTKKKQFIIADGRYYAQVAGESPRFKLIRREKGLSDILKDLFTQEKIKIILLDGSHTHYSFTENLKRAVKVIIKNDSELLHRLRIVKDAQELKYLAKAADISVAAFKRLLPLIKPGVTELWVAAKLEMLMKEAGSPKPAFETIVASGKNGVLPHARPTTKKIRKGELVTIDFGASYNGYMSDVTRTVAVGKVSAKLKEIYEVVRLSQELGCSFIKAGVPGRDVDELCREFISESGYGKYFLHSTGHGLGMSVHELPSVSAANRGPLPACAVVTCEPGIYIKGLGGVRIEDALVVKKGGAINLHGKLTKKLIALN
jgi:Xaa-Pro aminopeptidase